MWHHRMKAHKIYWCLKVKIIKHTQKIARCIHLNTLKKCLFAQRYEKQIKIEVSLQNKAIVASNTHAAITIVGNTGNKI
jgi:hypothetical protein